MAKDTVGGHLLGYQAPNRIQGRKYLFGAWGSTGGKAGGDIRQVWLEAGILEFFVDVLLTLQVIILGI